LVLRGKEHLIQLRRINMPKIIKNGVTYIGTSDNASAVSYDNTSSDLSATDVQGAIDEVSTELGATLKQAVIDAIYPVGSIYMTVSDDTAAKVKARFGGTWVAWGSGRVPVGVNTSDTSFDTVEETGGNKSNSYTPAGTIVGAQLPPILTLRQVQILDVQLQLTLTLQRVR
jgi:hypothetical protein